MCMAIRSIVWLPFALAATCLAGPATSSLPPPPQDYVWEASKTLTDATVKDQAAIEPLFADDVVASLNGQRIASGKEAWLKWWSDDRSHFYGATRGYSMGRKGDGVLLVVDQHDVRDNYTSPPPPGDPRWTTRSTLFIFGPDRMIHAVVIAEVDSFFRRTAN
jgi:hypothetical protein